MTPLTPRERAIAALEVIDRHHTATGATFDATFDAAYATLDAAYRELGAAMNAEYGPLPDERIGYHALPDEGEML